MTLQIRRGKRPAPDRILLFGTEGVGKSTWAASAPDPIFIAAEDGIRHLDVASLEGCDSYAGVMQNLADLATDAHDFKTVVVDTVDWLEPMVWASVCHARGWLTNGEPDIEKPGYGKGYIAANDEWRKVIAALARLRTEREMEIILLAHAQIRTFANPAGDDYARYETKLNKGAGALLKEWCDVNLFAVHEEFARKRKDGKVKGESSGRRVVHTERTAAWDAKNRGGLPPVLPLNYEDYDQARTQGIPEAVGKLLIEAEELLPLIDPTKHETIKATIAANEDNPLQMRRIVDRLRTLATKETA